MKRIITFCCGMLWFYTANSQTVPADVVTQNANDKFTYDNQDMPHYGLKWTVDSWNTGGNSAWLSGYAGIKLFSFGQPRVVVDISGRVGIGTTSPQQLLDVNGITSVKQSIFVKSNGVNSSEILLYKTDQTNYYDIISNVVCFGIYNSTTSQYPLYMSANDNIGIGTTSPTEKLSVNGNIRSRKVIVTQTNWPDYVFDSSYQLPSLDSVSTFIQVNKHLPDMPSAAAVEKDGHDLGEVQKMLLKKVEELTLYMIEIKKENVQLKNQNEQLIKDVKQLKALITN